MGSACSLCSSKSQAEPADRVQEEQSGVSAAERRRSYCSPQHGSKSKSSALGPAWGNECPFPEHIVGTFSNHGAKPDYGGRTTAKINQDRGNVCYPLAGHTDMALFAVYDGHGHVGEQVSEFIMLEVQKTVENDSRLRTDPGAVLHDAFLHADKQLRLSKVDAQMSGTTAVACILWGKEIYCANTGDSRATVGYKNPQSKKWTARDLSWDHKADIPSEMARIHKCGGYVTPSVPALGPARVWLSPGVGPGLAMSRSLGDFAVTAVGVTPEPEIQHDTLGPQDAFLVLASDGVWEFIESQQAVDMVAKYPNNASDACHKLMQEAADRWRREEGNYRDDITALVVYLPCLPQTGEDSKGASTPQAKPPGVVEPPMAVEEVAEPESSNSMTEAERDERVKTFAKRRLSVGDMSADLAAAQGDANGKGMEMTAQDPQ